MAGSQRTWLLELGPWGSGAHFAAGRHCLKKRRCSGTTPICFPFLTLREGGNGTTHTPPAPPLHITITAIAIASSTGGGWCLSTGGEWLFPPPQSKINRELSLSFCLALGWKSNPYVGKNVWKGEKSLFSGAGGPACNGLLVVFGALRMIHPSKNQQGVPGAYI